MYVELLNIYSGMFGLHTFLIQQTTKRRHRSVQHTQTYLKISGSNRATSFSGMYGGLLMTASNFVEPSNDSTDPKVQKENSNN